MTFTHAKLLQLVAVADAGSFSKAAAQLNLSQPALSRNVASLEARYGFRIFDRVGQGVALTTLGRQAIAQARSLVQDVRTFDRNLKLFGAGENGEISIGIGPLLASQLLPGLIRFFFERSPQIRIRTLIRPTLVLLDALRDDRIEMLVSPDTQIDSYESLDIERIGHLDPCFLVRASHPLASQTEVGFTDLRAFPFATSVDVALPGGGLQPGFLCDNFHILRDATLASDFVWITGGTFTGEEIGNGSLVKLDVQDYPISSSSILAATLKGRTRSPLAARVCGRLAEQLSSATS